MQEEKIIQKLIKVIRSVTLRYYENQEEEALSDKAREAKKIAAEFGNQRHVMAKFASLILGEKITFEASNGARTWPYMSCIVPTINGNGNNYNIGEPILMVQNTGIGGGDTFMKRNGSFGNHMDPALISSRPATPEEVISFIQGMPEDCRESLLKISKAFFEAIA